MSDVRPVDLRQDEPDAVVAYTTVGSQEAARKLAGELLGRKLIACAQMHGVESMYTWQGETKRDEEVLLVLKTPGRLAAELERAVLENHDYDTPEFVVVDARAVSPAYLAWMVEVTT